MVDWLTPEQRSRNMSSIRSTGNRSTEMALRFRLVRAGISGWKLCDKSLPGKPDFVFEGERIVVFVDGCYWHGCPKCYRAPQSNRGYWSAKLITNRARDRRATRLLKAGGWHVIRVWEHQIEASPGRIVLKISALLNGQPASRTLPPR